MKSKVERLTRGEGESTSSILVLEKLPTWAFPSISSDA